MTLYLSFRQQAVGGGVKAPRVLEGNGTVAGAGMVALADDRFARRAAGRDVLFAVHGFNVSQQQGLCSLGRLEVQLGLPNSCLFVGVLWPGDFWLPVVNYPFEGGPAMDCGRRLAAYCGANLGDARSLSFVTHSLGARLAPEATANLAVKVRCLCLTAAAINNDCLTTEYAAALANCGSVSLLASRRDWVLQLAFPAGDVIALLLDPDHVPLTAALGYAGPGTAPPGVQAPWQIADGLAYGHGDYMPPGDPAAAFPDPAGKWAAPAAFIEHAWAAEPQFWP